MENEHTYCCGCLSSTEQLIVPSKSIIETYRMLITCNNEIKSTDDQIPDNEILLCLTCTKMLLRIQIFQLSCRNSSLRYKNYTKMNENNNTYRKRIDQDLEKLIKLEKIVKNEVVDIVINVPVEDDMPDACDMDFRDSPELDEKNDFDDVTVKNETKQENEAVSIDKPIKVYKNNFKLAARDQIEHCPFCKESYPTFASAKNKGQVIFSEHMDKYHCIKASNSFCCKHCDGKYSKISNFRKHFRQWHMVASPFMSCKFCPKTFYNKNLFHIHVRSVHTALASRYICDICKKTFRDITSIRQHMTRHISKTICSNCNKSFHDKNSYKIHRKTCGYVCHFCSELVFTKNSLEKHIIRKHLPAPPCDICGKEFVRKMDLDHHKKIAHSQKTKVCEQCGKSFFTDHGLTSHIKFSHLKMENEYAKKRFWCDICQRFESSTTRSAHEMKAKYGKRYQCDKCEKAFFSNQRLKNHYHVHTKTRPFNCKLCETGYYHKSYLKSHYERVHGSEYLGAIRK